MNCTKCGAKSVKNGKSKTGVQRYKCQNCRHRFQTEYYNKAYHPDINDQIILFLREGVGIRGITRVLQISPTTVLKRIISISQQIQKPPILFRREYEMDEMMALIKSKNRRICIAYAIDRKSREVVGFSVGRRNKTTLREVTNSLLLSKPKQIRTDKCYLYLTLIPGEIHHVKKKGINRIERMNLTLRTH